MILCGDMTVRTEERAMAGAGTPPRAESGRRADKGGVS